MAAQARLGPQIGVYADGVCPGVGDGREGTSADEGRAPYGPSASLSSESILKVTQLPGPRWVCTGTRTPTPQPWVPSGWSGHAFTTWKCLVVNMVTSCCIRFISP